MQTLVFKVENEQHSKEIQDAIFGLGGGWSQPGGVVNQEYENLDKPLLHIKRGCRFYQFGELTGEYYLELLWDDPKDVGVNFAEIFPAHQVRVMPPDLSIAHPVTLDNFKNFFNKISFKSQYEKDLAK